MKFAMRGLPVGVLVFLHITGALSEPFNYIIVGAGASGLVLANRLSEDPSVTVAVIEPGKDESSNPLVTDPEQFLNSVGTYLDWNYTTVAQPGANEQEIPVRAGRAWGGSTAINGMTYIRGNREEIDIWGQLGNDGWSWDSLFPYFKKSEEYIRPNPAQYAAGGTYKIENHGLEGPIRVGYRPGLKESPSSPLMIETWDRLSVPLSPDLNGGDVRGFALGPQTVDPETDTRWDSARAYLRLIKDRSNLSVIKGEVTHITWQEQNETSDCHAKQTASGVAYLTADGETKTIEASGEVILSAGAWRSPGILEASGVGNPRILESFGIATKVNLPGVGESLQEQASHLLAFNSTLEAVPSTYQAFISASRLLGDKFSDVEAATRKSIPSWAQRLADAPGDCHLPASAISAQLRVQHDLVFKHDVSVAEILDVAAPGGVGATNYWLLFPFSRGCVHISDNPRKPRIDPKFYTVDFDMEMATLTGRLSQEYWNSSPLGEFIVGQVLPAEDALPRNATDEQWEAYFRSTALPNSHPYGTAAMMARELGGVVDSQLKVYETSNVRVVDASIIPMQVSGHPTALLYAVTERAANIIKGLLG